MARPKKNTSMEEEIVKQEEAVEKSKEKYDAEVKKLKDMYAKREEARRKALLDAVEKSSKSYEEIMAFVTARQED
ncbi:ErpK protein [Frisingicoccus sp.]|uniref:ErpK protein n=1 Tax=Frisingicoccus sp. TaxID=1918627 RepID=UPI002A76E470|nr:ErpK protein [Frisingicoccus sp.]MCI6534104.1 ErpK protein [Lachnospiraceae bacterium]MCI7181293.1 ErpK protein [Lachnospiraceae bacterium]MDY3020841.1 ErpK protein [Oliverpabstia sp.]